MIAFAPLLDFPVAADTEALAADLGAQAVQKVLRLGRGFGSVRTSLLIAAMAQLHKEKAFGTLPEEHSQLAAALAWQLSLRERRRVGCRATRGAAAGQPHPLVDSHGAVPPARSR